MHFQVPQFIETEDKIIGPLSLRQFLYVAVGGFSSFILYFILETWLWAMFALILLSISAALAFVKINGRSLSFFMKSALMYSWNSKVYIFKTDSPAPMEKNKPAINRATLAKKMTDGSHLRDIGEKLATTKTAIPKRELALPPALSEAPEKTKEHYEYVRKIAGDIEAARRVDYK